MDQPEPSLQPEPSPLDLLGVISVRSVAIDESLEHIEIYTMEGLLTVLWHGPTDASRTVLCVGGALGGLLGPDGGLYHYLGRRLGEQGIGVMRVGYRRPNDLDTCVQDLVAMMELSLRQGGTRLVTLGHAFGGAVAIQAAARFDAAIVPGVVTFATQSAGCEPVEQMGDRNLLFFHGTDDRILPPQSSEMVRFLAGSGELVLLDGADHALHPAGDELLERMLEHLPAVLGAG
jgi:pimeloyl-ACP methyl ester carboxylesterase